MRVNPKPRSAYPWYLRPFFWNQRRKYGAVLEPALLWARIPRLFLGIAWLNGALERRRSPLPGGLRALVSLRISQLNWCRFCIDMNSATLLKRGISQERLEALEE